MDNTKPKKSAAIKPQFCVATNQYELMLLMALFPIECKFVGLSVEHGRYIGALFTYHEHADLALRNWHKMTECEYDESEFLKTFFYYLAQCQLYGEPRKLFEHLMYDKNHYAYSREYIFNDPVKATIPGNTEPSFEKDSGDEI